VWKVRLIERMMDEGMPKKVLVEWYTDFLQGREARVRVVSEISGWKK